MSANFDIASSNSFMFETVKTFTFEKDVKISFTKSTSSLLFLAIVLLLISTCSLAMGMVTIRGAWSDEQHQSGWMQWVFNSEEPYYKNIKSMTEFESLELSKYLVGTRSEG